MTKRDAWSAMLAADQAFSDALRAAYGKRAGDMRYHTNKQSPEIRTLGIAFQQAAETWRAIPVGA